MNEHELDGLAVLMAETQARYPHQELAPGTADMYLAEWEEMAVRYGLEAFCAGLARTIRDRERRPFFPAPEEIEVVCRSARRERRERAESKAYLDELAERKATWERERAEEAGKPREYTEAERRLDEMLAAARANIRPEDRRRYQPPAGHDPQAIRDQAVAALRQAQPETTNPAV